MRFEEWRDEIASELEAARKELASRQADLDAAEARHRAASAECERHAEALNRLHQGVTQAGALAVRYDQLKEGAHAAKGAVSLARRNLVMTTRHIADLETALQQLDVIAPPRPTVTPVETNPVTAAA